MDTFDEENGIPGFGSLAGELANDHFKIQQRSSDQKEDEGVGHEVRAAAVRGSLERETPNVAQADSIRDARHDELEFAAPLAGISLLHQLKR